MLNSRYLLLPLVLAPLSVQAAIDYQWTFTNTATCVTNCNAITIGNGSNGGLLDSNQPSGGNSAYVSGTTDGNGKGNSQTFNQSAGLAATVNVSGFSQSTALPNALDTATLALYGGNGLGISKVGAAAGPTFGDGVIGAAPEHAFDNTNGTDVGLFKFNANVNLQSVSIGYVSGDADFSVLAYKPSGANPAAPATLVGQTLANLLTSGWQWVGNYSGASGTTSVNTGNVSSSYWLITAASSAFGGTVDGVADYFKISGLGASKVTTGGGNPVGSVPEPTSLLLLASGMLGWRLNRKNQALAA